jgi:hypothetical protein
MDLQPHHEPAARGDDHPGDGLLLSIRRGSPSQCFLCQFSIRLKIGQQQVEFIELFDFLNKRIPARSRGDAVGAHAKQVELAVYFVQVEIHSWTILLAGQLRAPYMCPIVQFFDFKEWISSFLKLPGHGQEITHRRGAG